MEAQGIQLTEQRARIDAIDERILRWLNRRVEAGVAIGQIKKDIGIGSVDEEREAGVLKRLRAINDGPLSEAAVLRIFRTIIEETRNAQRQPLASGASAARNGQLNAT